MLSVFWLVLNYSCNNRCVACYAESKDFENIEIPLDYANQVLETMNKSNVRSCLLLGGEPTLYVDLHKVVKKASELGIKTTLITNF